MRVRQCERMRLRFPREQNAGNAASADQCDAKQRRHVERRVPRHPSNDA